MARTDFRVPLTYSELKLLDRAVESHIARCRQDAATASLRDAQDCAIEAAEALALARRLANLWVNGWYR